MKKLLFPALLMLSLAGFGQGGLLNSLKKTVSGSSQKGSGLSSDDIVAGLKQALSLGAQKAVTGSRRSTVFLRMRL